MKPLGQGTLLTPEQSLRLTIVDSVTRERLIEYITQHLRKGLPRGDGRKLACPSLQTLYQRPIR